jgi:isopentenyl-diphosphate delta-isomerase type 1
MSMTEYFDVVDSKDRVVGKASREECHSGKKLLHRCAFILVFNSKGEMLMEKRSMKKDLYPGWWDIVAGHPKLGEEYEKAAKREMREEIGVTCELKALFKMIVESEREREVAQTFSCMHEGPFRVNRKESDEVRFFSRKEMKEALRTGKMKIPETTAQALEKFFGMQTDI